MKLYGLSKKERVVKDKDFEAVYKKGKRIGNNTLFMRILPNGLDYARLGIIVSKKEVRNATDRNRLKRLIREAFRLSKRQLSKGIDVLVGPRRPELTLAEVKAALLKLLA
ncbi:MAG: ribonuclease P protein component [Planctomycetes bacterium]|nr:ribonuclease P protein component [Planctomycetota bacterium]